MHAKQVEFKLEANKKGKDPIYPIKTPWLDRTGAAKKKLGMDLASRNNESFLHAARAMAITHSRRHGNVTADDVRSMCEAANLAPGHQNAWGCVFKCDGFVRIGYKKSVRPAAHSTVIGVWRYNK